MSWYSINMSTKLKEIAERAQSWPPEQQEAAVEMLLALEAQHSAPSPLTDEQADEVRHRLLDPNPRFLTLEEVRTRLTARTI